MGEESSTKPTHEANDCHPERCAPNGVGSASGKSSGDGDDLRKFRHVRASSIDGQYGEVRHDNKTVVPWLANSRGSDTLPVLLGKQFRPPSVRKSQAGFSCTRITLDFENIRQCVPGRAADVVDLQHTGTAHAAELHQTARPAGGQLLRGEEWAVVIALGWDRGLRVHWARK